MDKKFLAEFESPGNEYRGAPFWAWNGKLDPEKLRRQVRIMHRMGLGGFFMHSRVGLATRYLGDEFFAGVRACVDEAKKLGMKAWLYDEDRWPSGFAGALVTSDPKYRMRRLDVTRHERPAEVKWNADIVAVFRARIDGSNATGACRIARGRKPGRLARGESLLVFRKVVTPTDPSYNNGAYLDTLNPEAGRAFVKTTHQAYGRRFHEDFGGVVPGIFTDEPNYAGMVLGDLVEDNPLRAPWTESLPAAFKKRHGYDLIPHLPEIFFDVDGTEMTPARLDFVDCVTQMFVDAFARPIHDWCEKNGMLATGHVLSEELPSTQTVNVGSPMRFYEFMQAPGMDLLTEHQREYDTAKCVSSAARQFGRKWRLTETYGCTGWDFPFVGHKALGDWQVALGINLRCQHLSWYTMEGQAKRDYPAAIFYQSPWWECYPKVEDYFARVHAAMTRGVEVRDLLVIHPIESTWSLCKRGWWPSRDAAEWDASLIKVRDMLLGANLDFDYGDEDILSRHGKVISSKGEPILRVAKAPYKAVLVPPMRTVRSSTLKLLENFRARGGKVVFAGAPPKYVDGRPSDAALLLARSCETLRPEPKAVIAAVEETCRRVSIADGNGKEIAPALHLLREDGDAFYLFVCNTGHTSRQLKPMVEDPTMVRDRLASFPDVRIRGLAGCKGKPVELDAETGETYLADAVRRGGELEIKTSLPPSGSRLFVIPKKGSGARVPKRPRLKVVRRIAMRPKRWQIALSDANNLVLDRPRYRIGNTSWREPEEILRIDQAVREKLGLAARGGDMVQPWAREIPENPKRVPVVLEYTFDVKTVPGGETFLAIENPGRFRITLNEIELSPDSDTGWWTDRSLRRIPFDPSILVPGRNTLSLSCDYDETFAGLECVYLLGRFGVRVRGTEVAMTAPPDTLRIGDWVGQGLPFYSGSVSYCRTIRPALRKGDRLFVATPDYRGVGVRVLVNGQPAGVIAWAPFEVEITDLMGSEGADLRIEVLGHRRNSHGPLHCAEKWPEWTGPTEYVTSGKAWKDGYNLVPCGLLKPPQLVVRR